MHAVLGCDARLGASCTHYVLAHLCALTLIRLRHKMVKTPISYERLKKQPSCVLNSDVSTQVDEIDSLTEIRRSGHSVAYSFAFYPDFGMHLFWGLWG